MGKKSFFDSKIFPVVLGVMAIAMALIPCYQNGIFEGHDLTFHTLRMESICEAIKAGGSLKQYVFQHMMVNYGYAAGIFYPDIMLYPAVLFRFMGASIDLSMKLLIGIYYVAAAFTAYYGGKVIARDTRVAIITMMLFTFGNYHMLNTFIRGALGELAAMIFVPLLFAGLYNLTEQGYTKKGILFAAFTGLMFCHTISLALSGIVAIIWVLIRCKKVLNKKCILGVLSEALLCVLVTAYYWLPMLEQFANDTFYVSVYQDTFPSDEAMTFSRIYGGIFSICFMELALLLLLVALGAKYKNLSKKAAFALGMVVFILLLEVVFPWDMLSNTPISSIQFAFRLNIFTEFLAAIGVACQLRALFGTCTKKHLAYTFVIVLGLGAFEAFYMCAAYMPEEHIDYISFSEDMLSEYSKIYETGDSEWLPAAVDEDYVKSEDNADVVTVGAATYSGYANEDGSYSFDCNGKTGNIIFPKVYYKGYAAYGTLETGETISLEPFESENGLVEVTVADTFQRVTIYYQGTIIQKYSKYITALGIVLMFLYIFGTINKKEKNHGAIKSDGE